MSCLSFLHSFTPRTLFPVTGYYSTHLKIVTSRSNMRPYSEFSYGRWSPSAFKEKASRKLHTGFPFLSDKSLPSTHVKPVGEKVKQASKDIFYTGVVVAGIGITGTLGYLIFRELFSSGSPYSVYKDALKRCKNDVRVQSILGSPVKAYGELGSMRGRRNHILSAEWKEPEGNQQITVVQVKFHISGPYNRGVVYVEKNVSSGEYRTLIFQTDDKRERFSVLQPAEPKSSLFSLA